MKKEMAQELAEKINKAGIGYEGIRNCNATVELQNEEKGEYRVDVTAGDGDYYDKKIFSVDGVFEVCREYKRLLILAESYEDPKFGKELPKLIISDY